MDPPAGSNLDATRSERTRRIEALTANGVDALQLRGKGLSGADLLTLARELRAFAARAGIPLLVNDRIDVALAVRAHGVQLGAGSVPIPAARRLLPPGSLIGYSAHSAAEADGAALAGADFVLLAPIFTPGSPKPNGHAPALGMTACRQAAAALSIPVYALGGVTPERAAVLRAPAASGEAPPAGVAAIGALFGAPDPGAAARAFRAALDGGVRVA